MEKVTFKNFRNLTLVGNFYPSSPENIIIMCHGFTSDKSSRGRFDRFANAFHQLGYSVLAFDFSGCGESDDERLTMTTRIDDLHAAISFVKSREFSRIALFGHSLGSRVCLECYTDQIATMVLTGALTGSMKYDWNNILTKEELQELKEKGYITKNQKHRKVIIDKQMLIDFELVNQKELLTNVKCPVLIMNGDADEEERDLYKLSKHGMKWLPKDSKLELIQGATHSFTDRLPVIEKLATKWFLKNFPLLKK
ncbi:alpha/beta hydrolase [Shimazuella alba]|uniref:Alpha/beta fold hydrolase n=1 Tax=Shimazuella alba TaxID=2690964 RepID=A0A6I4VT83_9BACL|nr:alpha/beta fold hydrolase [Shimazuella alba]MXQ54959.1 alpha/beta fold hydrolase [Shimazuella alba]